MSTALDLSWGSQTSRGPRRTRNEDGWYAGEGVFGVADGMGGHLAGDVASALAVGMLEGLAAVPGRTAADVVAGVGVAHRRIVRQGAAHAGQVGMGTTLAAIVMVLNGGVDDAVAVNVGDSRIYRYRAGRLDQISVDHSQVAELVAQGLLTSHEAAGHPDRHVVTRRLGGPIEPAPDVWFLQPCPGDRYLLCTDGLCDTLDDVALREELAFDASAQMCAARLVARAGLLGARDDVTAVVVDVQERLAGPDDGAQVAEATLPRGDDDAL